jgi:Asp/Glu/hydantoin racemase
VAGVVRRILVINSNSSASVTSQIADAVEPVLAPGTEATFVNPVDGPPGIDSRMAIAVSGVETAKLVAAHSTEFDAFVIACGSDPGLAAAREATDRPVLGIAESGMLLACALGGTFSIASLGSRRDAFLRVLVRGYGLESRLAGLVRVSASSKLAAEEPDRLLALLLAAGSAMPAGSLGDALVLTGSVVGKHDAALSRELGIPVVSGLSAAVRSAEALANSGLRTATRLP